MTCGATTGDDGAIWTCGRCSAKQLSILGSYMGTKGELLRAARLFFAGQLKPVDRSDVPAGRGRRGAAAAGDVGAVRQDRARSACDERLQRVGVSVFTLIAIVSIVLAAATIWLFVTNPVTVATAVNEGEITPLVRNLAEAIYAALSGILKYL